MKAWSTKIGLEIKIGLNRARLNHLGEIFLKEARARPFGLAVSQDQMCILKPKSDTGTKSDLRERMERIWISRCDLHIHICNLTHGIDLIYAITLPSLHVFYAISSLFKPILKIYAIESIVNKKLSNYVLPCTWSKIFLQFSLWIKPIFLRLSPRSKSLSFNNSIFLLFSPISHKTQFI